MSKWGMQKSLCTSQWKAPHTHTQGMQGILLGNFSILDCHFCHSMRGFWQYWTSVQSRLHFCIIDMEYSILMQNQIIMESYWCNKGYLIYTSPSKAAVNVQNKKGVLTSLKWACRKTVIWDSWSWVAFVSGLSRCTERDWSVHFDTLYMFFCWSIQALFFELVLFLYYYETITKAKFINRITVEHEKHEDGLDKKGEVVQSVNILVWPRPFLSLSQWWPLPGLHRDSPLMQSWIKHGTGSEAHNLASDRKPPLPWAYKLEDSCKHNPGVSISTNGWWDTSASLLIEVGYFFTERSSN